MSDSETRTTASEVELRALESALRRARAVLLWERVWPRIVSFLIIFGAVLAVSWLGFWQVVPYWARMSGVIGVGLLLLGAAVPILTIKMPTRAEALSRVDARTGGSHRPASTIADKLSPNGDPFAKALWAEHRRRVLEKTGAFKAGVPAPRMARIDRYAIRALALLLIVPAYFLAGDERTQRLLTAFDWRAPPAQITYRIDAWVTPPAYTGRAPTILPTRRSVDGQTIAQQSREAFRVPQGSVLTLRITGLAAVDIKPDGGIGPVEIKPVAEGQPAPPAIAGETLWTIGGDGGLALAAPGIERMDWRFEAVPDRRPTITFERDSGPDQRGHLTLTYKLEDDYGVTEAEARLALAPAARALQREGARPLAELPPIPLALPQARTRAGTGQTTRDLLAHPFAGLPIAITLVAKDDAGNAGESPVQVAVLPNRSFNKPIPRVIVEQRRILALDANARIRVARALEAVTIAPDRFGLESAVYLGLRTAYYRTLRARTDAQLQDVIDYLWDIAVRIEDGDVSEAERAAQAAAERLRQAIERGASEEEIRRLSQELRQAMDRLMRELAEQALRNRQDGQNQQQARRQDGQQNPRNVRPQDLRDMLNRIEQLARNGARDQAQRLMQELQQMLQGMQAGRQQQQESEMGDGTEQGESALDQLADMIRRQQQLRDQTFQRGQEQRRAQRPTPRGQQRPGQQGQQDQQGQQGEGQDSPPGFSELAENQRQLRELLDQLNQQLGQGDQNVQGGQGQGEIQQGLGNAGRAMREAEGSLGRGDSQGAMDAQARALRGLQQGAQGLAQQMHEGQQQQGQNGQQGQPGRTGNAGNQDYDPLGRPTRGREANDNSSVRIPNAGEGAAQRAQRVLEELRRRLSEPDRPRMEQDYIERLLRGLQIQ